MISLKDDCKIIGIFPPESVGFKKDEVNIPTHFTFSDAKIKDGDTIVLDMDIYVSDPNIFESVFSRSIHDCDNPMCQINVILKSFKETSEKVKNFKFWETDTVGVKMVKPLELLTLTGIEKMGDVYYFLA